jgi:hypothetical protein
MSHITINSSEKVLKVANGVCKDFSSLYEPVKPFEGGAFFLLENGFVRNTNYTSVPEIKWLKTASAEKLVRLRGERAKQTVHCRVTVQSQNLYFWKKALSRTIFLNNLIRLGIPSLSFLPVYLFSIYKDNIYRQLSQKRQQSKSHLFPQFSGQ